MALSFHGGHNDAHRHAMTDGPVNGHHKSNVHLLDLGRSYPPWYYACCPVQRPCRYASPRGLQQRHRHTGLSSGRNIYSPTCSSLTLCKTLPRSTLHVATCNARGFTLLPAGCNNVAGTLAGPVGFGCRRVAWHVSRRIVPTLGTAASPEAAFSACPSGMSLPT